MQKKKKKRERERERDDFGLLLLTTVNFDCVTFLGDTMDLVTDHNKANHPKLLAFQCI